MGISSSSPTSLPMASKISRTAPGNFRSTSWVVFPTTKRPCKSSLKAAISPFLALYFVTVSVSRSVLDLGHVTFYLT